MLNKVDGASSNVIRRIESRSSESPSPFKAETSTSSNANKDVLPTLTERAQSLAKASPDVDMSRVRDIKDAISRGEFTIDAKAVARAFIAMESA
ncbi:flagellar biosynthesis anti-sigma factor FlgM [Perlucidibaca aquatica]|jgi:flagellar biosynthesis anti-sigma factor FlgM|uniref:flagellar biosynthesis anti-sigma factor FlgM n=1 Tax=Perlucidibaca aquatica TaxID=1852776 RepID=UPI00083B0AC8|nr:flagellar biosynthesis anti-sigma factor FlgM [Perlucidibaca aquatica]